MKICLISGKAGSGKDELADFIRNELYYDYHARVGIIHFGDAVKCVATQLYGWNHIKDPDGRQLLQYVGTEVGRAKYPVLWAEFIAQILSAAENDFDYAIIPDARFINEITTMKQYFEKVIVVRVDRPNFHNLNMSPEELEHISETQLDTYPSFDYIIENSGDTEHLRELGHKIGDYLYSL